MKALFLTGKEVNGRWSVELIYGRNQRDHFSIPLDGLVATKEPPLQGALVGRNGWSLPEGKFQIGRLDQDHVVLRKGEDTTNRLFLISSHLGGFRGWVELVPAATSASILMSAVAGNACESEAVFASLLQPGDCIVVRRYGRHIDDVDTWSWDGSDIHVTSQDRESWVTNRRLAAGENVEVL